MNFKTSAYRRVSIGIVAADKPEGSRYIEVYPIEILPFFEGEISNTVVPVEKSGTSSTGETYNITLNKGMAVKADWAGESNRRTSPNVKKGEQVDLYSQGDSERYFWVTKGRDDHLRDTETITWTFAARAKGGKKVTADDSWSVTVDTLKQNLTILTSKVNGEFAKYTIQINAKQGNITAKDDEGNIVQLDSRNVAITLKNAEGSSIQLNKKNVSIEAKGDYSGKFGLGYSLTIGGSYEETVIGSKVVKVGGNYSIEAKSNYEIKCTGDYTVNGINVSIGGKVIDVKALTSFDIKSPLIGLGGAVTVAGSFSMKPGTVGGTDTATFSCPVDFQMPVGFTKPVDFIDLVTFKKLATFGEEGIVTPKINGQDTALAFVDT